jgi:DNA-binding MarR family transcriptional regulator
MSTKHVISLIANIREKANKLILHEMNHCGISGIVPSHGDIIVALLQERKLTMKEIAARIDKDKSTVTALVDKLIKMGYVEKNRNLEDHREVFVSLTERGLALKPQFDTVSSHLLSVVYNGISEEEKEILINILTKMKNNL